MKILIITSTLYERSGWGRYSRGVVEALLKSGVEVVLLCEQKPEDNIAEWHKLKPAGSPISFIQNILAVRKLAKHVDIVHALDAWPFGVYGYMGTLGMSKKNFINGVGTYSVAPLYSPWLGWMVKRAYRAAAGVFCISAYTKAQIQKAGVFSQNITVVHMGNDRLPIVSQEEKEKYQSELLIDVKKFPIILTVGAIKNRKGQLDTLKAVGHLKEKYPNILYIAAGSGNSEAYVQDMRAFAASHGLVNNLLIVSNIDDKKLSYLYSACTVVALNSNNDTVAHHFEGFGLVITEGYQFGKPAVGSRDCGIEDAIDDGKSGFLTNQGDPSDIAEKIKQILANYDFFSRNAAAWYTAFDWKKTVAAYINFYNA